MKIESVDGKQERDVLIGMIVSSKVLGRIAPYWSSKPLRSRYANTAGQWCVDYWNRYHKAPKKSIKNLYRSWSQGAEKEQLAIMDRFLSGLSNQYSRLRKDINPDEVVDMAGELFERVRQERLIKDITAHHTRGDLKKAALAITKYEEPKIGTTAGIDFLEDKSGIDEAMEQKPESIVKYKDGLGTFFGDALERDALVAIMAPEKTGKTWMLIDLAWRSMKQGRRTAFFEVGDLSRNQLRRRLIIRMSGRPLQPGKIIVPTYLSVDGASVDTSPLTRKYKNSLDVAGAKKKLAEMAKQAGNRHLLRLSVHPNDSISASQVENILSEWKRRGWSPDVVIIDYADILAPMDGRQESRDQINATWKRLRRISQEFHCLVVTATQTNALSYKAELIDRSHFSEDKRKYAHVNGMAAMSQTDTEKKLGVFRMNWLELRESYFDRKKVVTIAGCLSIGQPAMFSIFGK